MKAMKTPVGGTGSSLAGDILAPDLRTGWHQVIPHHRTQPSAMGCSIANQETHSSATLEQAKARLPVPLHGQIREIPDHAVHFPYRMRALQPNLV